MQCIAGGTARAQTPPEPLVPERQSILQQPRPDYDPLGIHEGSFLVFPTVDLQEAYDSNVFATQTDVRGDFFTTLRPAVAVNSDWNNHALNFRSSGEAKVYARDASEDVANFNAALDGRLDIQRGIYVLAGAGYQILHEDRGAPNAPTNNKDPVEYHVSSANLGLVHDQGLLALRTDLTADLYTYDNVAAVGGGTILEKDRNVGIYTVAPRVSYELDPGYRAFLKVSGNERDYENKFDNLGFQHSSHGYEIDTGTALDLGGIVSGEAFVGYFRQDYDDPRQSAVTGPSFGGNLLWNITRLTSIRGIVTRTIEETTVTSAGIPATSYLQTSVAISVEHELLRNVLLAGSFTFSDQSFQGSTQIDYQYEGKIGARYLLNRNLWASADVTLHQQISNVPGIDYQRGVISLGIRAQF